MRSSIFCAYRSHLYEYTFIDGYLCIYGELSDNVTFSDYMASNSRMAVNSEGRGRGLIRGITLCFPGEADRNHERCLGSLCRGQDSNRALLNIIRELSRESQLSLYTEDLNRLLTPWR
jgi:hypothetical protein